METKKEIKYPYLPAGVNILYVPESNIFMSQAKDEAKKSNDQSMPNGSVIVSDGVVVGRASNKPALSNQKLLKLHKKYCIRRMLNIPSGQKYWLCPGCASHANHGEYRAVLDVQKKNINNLKNPELYLWGHWWCCEPCWNKMLEIGIKKVFLLEGSEILFNINNPNNIIGKQLK